MELLQKDGGEEDTRWERKPRLLALPQLSLKADWEDV